MIVSGTDLLYMDNIDGNYIQEFEALVIGKKVDEKGRTYLVLDRSAFYPAGGGQPTDTGTLNYQDQTSEERRKVTIVRVAKKDEIRHYIEKPNKSDETIKFDESKKSDETDETYDLEPGMKVIGTLDWEQRYAYMKMHTAQHLVSSIVYDSYDAATVGNQIYADRSRIDFSPLAHDEVDTADIENQCNELIRINPRVKVFFEKRSLIENSKDAERCNVQLIPQSVRELRIVKIQDVELCPCAGTHIRNLGEIKGIRIIGVRSKGKAKVRITYELL